LIANVILGGWIGTFLLRTIVAIEKNLKGENERKDAGDGHASQADEKQGRRKYSADVRAAPQLALKNEKEQANRQNGAYEPMGGLVAAALHFCRSLGMFPARSSEEWT
jgi:hypothetical protein